MSEWVCISPKNSLLVKILLSYIAGLTQLDLNYNQLVGLPKSLSNLRKLEQLYARHNAIQVIPPLNNCASLKELHLGNNFIKVGDGFIVKPVFIFLTLSAPIPMLLLLPAKCQASRQ